MTHPFVVETVDAGSAVHSAHVKPGHVLTMINGAVLMADAADSILQQLETRPLTLSFFRHSRNTFQKLLHHYQTRGLSQALRHFPMPTKHTISPYINATLQSTAKVPVES